MIAFRPTQQGGRVVYGHTPWGDFNAEWDEHGILIHNSVKMREPEVQQSKPVENPNPSPLPLGTWLHRILLPTVRTIQRGKLPISLLWIAGFMCSIPLGWAGRITSLVAGAALALVFRFNLNNCGCAARAAKLDELGRRVHAALPAWLSNAGPYINGPACPILKNVKGKI